MIKLDTKIILVCTDCGREHTLSKSLQYNMYADKDILAFRIAELIGEAIKLRGWSIIKGTVDEMRCPVHTAEYKERNPE